MFTLTRLEDRIVFDASPIAVADAPDAANETPDSPEAAERAVDKVLVVDMAVDNAEALASAARDDVQVVRYDSRTDSLARLQELIAEACAGSTFASIAFAGHGEAGRLFLASDAAIDLQTLVDNPDLAVFFEALSGYLSEGGRVDLLGCDVASGDAGEELIATLEELTGIDFAASDDPTGNVDDSGDWLLETDDVDAAATYFDADELEQFAGLLLNVLDGMVDIDFEDNIDLFTDEDTIFKDGGLQINGIYLDKLDNFGMLIVMDFDNNAWFCKLLGLPECNDPAEAGSGFWIVRDGRSGHLYLDGSLFARHLIMWDEYSNHIIVIVESGPGGVGYQVHDCYFPSLTEFNQALSNLILRNVGADQGKLELRIDISGEKDGSRVYKQETLYSHIHFKPRHAPAPEDGPTIDNPVINDPIKNEPQIIDTPVIDDPAIDESVSDEPVENDPGVQDSLLPAEYSDHENEAASEPETESATIEPVAWHFDVEEFGHSAGEIAERLEELTVDMRIDAPEVADTVEALAVFTSSIGAFNGHVDALIALLPNLDPRALANSPELVRWIRSSSHQGETLTAQSRRCLERLGALGMAMRSSPQAARDPSGLQQLAAMGRFLDNVNVNMQASIAGMEIFLRRVGESDGDVDLNLLYQEIVDAENQTRTLLKSELLKRDSIYRLRQTRDAVRGSI